MKLTEKQLAEMEQNGARVIRKPGSRKKAEQPEKPVAEKTVAAKEPVQQKPSVEGEALRMLVAQNSEALQAIGAALSRDRNYDAEVIRDTKVKGEYKPITHVRIRSVIGA